MNNFKYRYSLLNTYENKNSRGIWDKEQFNWFIENFCKDCFESKVDSNKIYFESIKCLYSLSGLYEYVLHELSNKNLDNYFNLIQSMYNKNYNANIDLYKEDIVSFHASSIIINQN